MGEVDLKNALMAGEPQEADDTAEVKTHAGVVTVRALTRKEVLNLNSGRQNGELNIAEYEAVMVSKGLVSPKMSVAEVSSMQDHEKAGSGALKDITDKIAELSGLAEGADKSGVPSPSGS